MGNKKQGGEEQFIFDGFDEPNFTAVPDKFFDRLLKRLSGAEIKVVLYIIRRTFGFKKQSDEISFSQICSGIIKKDGTVLDEGTGLSKSTAQIAIKGLLQKKIIFAVKRNSFERGNEPTNYALNLSGKTSTPYAENRHRGVPNFGIALYRKSATQETVLQKNNVNVGFVRNGKGEPANDDDDKTDYEAYLLSEIVRHTGDTNPKSLSSFRRVIRKLGSGVSENILVNTKEAYQDGRVPASKRAAYFIGMAKNIATERGIDLGFRNGSEKMQAVVANLSKQIGNRSVVRNMKFDRDEAE